MLLILTITYLLHGTIQAAPISNVLRDTSSPDISPSNQCLCPDQQRSLWDILWSCLSVIFACTWVSVHPNISPAGEKWWKTILRRLELMLWGILAPEMIVYWAMKQWIGAHKLEQKYKGLGWTKTHGYFVQMGGFTLYKGEEPQGVLLHKRLAILFESGKIELPKITETEIEDRSKGDGLSKALAVGQTGWFVMQCIARRAQGLIITELELATVAFAVVNVAIYFLWWKKPLDVQCSVPVYLLDEPKNMPEKVESPVEKSHSTFRNLSFFEPIRTSLKTFWTSVRARPIWATIILALEWAALGILIIVVSILGGILMIVFTPFVAAPGRLSEVFHPDQTEDEKLASVTAFYSIHDEDAHDNLTPFVTTIIASIFGCLHCVGWFFTYPSHAEMLIWRICSTFTAVLPWAMILTKFVGDSQDNGDIDSWACIFGCLLLVILFPIMVVSAGLYVVARLLLLGEAFAALRFLPPEALAVVEWIEFLPHI